MRTLIRDALQESSFLSKNQQKSEILTIEEVAELTGYKKTTIYKLTHERKIPFHKPAHGGRRIFFKREEINQWLQSNRVETHEEFLKSWRGKNECKIKNSMEKINQRDSFVFYRSYLESIELLSIKKQLLAYKALVKYGLNQEEMENLPPQVAIILKIAKPNIDANIRNYNRRIKNKERKKMSDLKKEVNDKVQLPEREDEFLLGEDFEEPDDNDSLLE